LTLDGELGARIIFIACGETSEGYSHWTQCLLADKTVKQRYTDSISHILVGQALKKQTSASFEKLWCIPPEQNAVFVVNMEFDKILVKSVELV